MPKVASAKEFLKVVFAHRARKTELFVASFRLGEKCDRAPPADGHLRNIPGREARLRQDEIPGRGHYRGLA